MMLRSRSVAKIDDAEEQVTFARAK